MGVTPISSSSAIRSAHAHPSGGGPSTTRHARDLENLEADDDGLFESVLVQAPTTTLRWRSYETGDAVMQQSADLAKRLKGEISAKHLAQMLRADARSTSCCSNTSALMILAMTMTIGRRSPWIGQPAQRGGRAGQVDRRPADWIRRRGDPGVGVASDAAN